eukprot:COSAG06_NODE_581_length_14007_cov_3.569056_10_plen_63_part_00
MRDRRLPPPNGLDTVQMLRAASAAMSLSPHKAMQVAEQLYMSGLISYPRTVRHIQATELSAR